MKTPLLYFKTHTIKLWKILLKKKISKRKRERLPQEKESMMMMTTKMTVEQHWRGERKRV